MRYVVDPKVRFSGAVITCMSDDLHCDYYGQTIEEMRVERKNPDLITIGEEEMAQMYRSFIEELHNEPPIEITEDQFYDMEECLPPARYACGGFFIGEPYYGDIYGFCFKVHDRFFQCHKRIGTPKEQLQREINDFAKTLVLTAS